MSILKRKFLEYFNMERIALDLMDLIEDIDMTCEVLDNFVYEKFNEVRRSFSFTLIRGGKKWLNLH